MGALFGFGSSPLTPQDAPQSVLLAGFSAPTSQAPAPVATPLLVPADSPGQVVAVGRSVTAMPLSTPTPAATKSPAAIHLQTPMASDGSSFPAVIPASSSQTTVVPDLTFTLGPIQPPPTPTPSPTPSPSPPPTPLLSWIPTSTAIFSPGPPPRQPGPARGGLLKTPLGMG